MVVGELPFGPAYLYLGLSGPNAARSRRQGQAPETWSKRISTCKLNIAFPPSCTPLV